MCVILAALTCVIGAALLKLFVVFKECQGKDSLPQVLRLHCALLFRGRWWAFTAIIHTCLRFCPRLTWISLKSLRSKWCWQLPCVWMADPGLKPWVISGLHLLWQALAKQLRPRTPVGPDGRKYLFSPELDTACLFSFHAPWDSYMEPWSMSSFKHKAWCSGRNTGLFICIDANALSNIPVFMFVP